MFGGIGMSKYHPLWHFVLCQSKDYLIMTFDEIKDILGFSIDHAFLTFKKELLIHGFEVHKISLKDKTVIFKRLSQ